MSPEMTSMLNGEPGTSFNEPVREMIPTRMA